MTFGVRIPVCAGSLWSCLRDPTVPVHTSRMVATSSSQMCQWKMELDERLPNTSARESDESERESGRTFFAAAAEGLYSGQAQGEPRDPGRHRPQNIAQVVQA